MSTNEPIDWAWERDKARAAIHRSAVLTPEEVESSLKSIDEKFATRQKDWERHQYEKNLNKNPADAVSATRYSKETEDPSLSEYLARNKQEQAATIAEGERRQREQITEEVEINSEYTVPRSAKHLRAYEVYAAETNLEPRGTTTAQLNQVRPVPTIRRNTAHESVVRGSDVKRVLPSIVTPLKFSIESTLAQVASYREDVRQNNQLRADHFEFHEDLLKALDRIRDNLLDLYSKIPEDAETVSEPEAEKVASIIERLKNENAIQAKKYLSPEAILKAAYPSGIVLTCSIVGSLFGPAGIVAGGITGNVIVNNIKADVIANKFNQNQSTDTRD